MDTRLNQVFTYLSSLHVVNLMSGDFNMPSASWNPLRGQSYFGKFINSSYTLPLYIKYTSPEFPGSAHNVVDWQLIVWKCSCTSNGTKVLKYSICSFANTNWSYS